ncbi:ComF family protein [Streptomyces sp. WMMB 322]|uniref:ComF family protein n=1 Tax=Streptomyces sp. WMMB 322 TaxID=1286821 RepID=UPI0034A0BE3A
MLLAHKERGALRLARPLGGLLATAVREARIHARRAPGKGVGEEQKRPLTLVPVPSARLAVAGRGHDPVRRVALAAARELRREGLPARVLTVLRQRRTVADQAGLTARERAVNLSGALELVPGSAKLLTGEETLLVDDVMTTGSSLAEAARALGEGARTVSAAAVVAFRRKAEKPPWETADN